jgi:hypothetical protein
MVSPYMLRLQNMNYMLWKQQKNKEESDVRAKDFTIYHQFRAH